MDHDSKGTFATYSEYYLPDKEQGDRLASVACELQDEATLHATWKRKNERFFTTNFQLGRPRHSRSGATVLRTSRRVRQLMRGLQDFRKVIFRILSLSARVPAKIELILVQDTEFITRSMATT